MPEVAPVTPAAAPKPALNGAPPPAAAPPATAAPADAATPVAEAEHPETGKQALIARAKEKKQVERERLFARQQEEWNATKTREMQEFDKYKRELALSREDPLAWFKNVHNMDDQALAGRLLNKNKPSPHETQAQYDKRIADLEAQLGEMKKGEQKRAFELTLEKQFTAFEGKAKEGADRWPMAARLAESNPKKFRDKGWELAVANPRLEDEDYLDSMEEELGFYAGLAKDKKSAASPSGPKSTPADVTKPAPSSQSASAGSVADLTQEQLAKLSPAERREYTLKQLAALRAERKAAGKK